jgi:hypothetical protein
MSEYLIETNKNSYIAFDPISLRDTIVSRLNQGQIFTDQNYQGSNLAALIDVISYSFSTLLFYLNKTSSESMFSEAQIYENMNRIVKLLNYKPVGRLTQNASFDISINSTLPPGNYSVPRYSYLNVGDVPYSINQDISFSNTTTETGPTTVGEENTQFTNNNYLIYQGIFEEYPTYTAIGLENEVVYLALSNETQIDHFNIFVYVKQLNASKWEKWNFTTDLFLYRSNDLAYETRFNENKRYEVSFGDGINGKKLNKGDQVAIYYLRINPNAEPLGANAINNAPLVAFNSTRFNQILQDTSESYGTYLGSSNINNISLTNQYPSTSYVQEENVDNIRKNAPQRFRSQYRLITTTDYESFLKTNFGNVLADVKILDNDTYLNQHLKYLYDIGLNSPQLQNQVLFNQVKFANSCNFNNLYFYGVPQSDLQEYLTPAQKELILNNLQESKTLTTQIVPMDPVYINLAFYIQAPNQPPNIEDIYSTKLLIIKEPNTRRANSAIQSDVANTIRQTFNRKNSKLGQTINLYQLASDILQVDGVYKIQTYRQDYQIYVDGISLLAWNSIYGNQDVYTFTQNLPLEPFKYPIFNDASNLEAYIQIESLSPSIKAAEF